MGITSRTVAEVAGVSQSTVSRVLGNHPGVRLQTRERVLRALKATDYVPSAIARALRTNRTGTIGIVVAQMANPFYPELIRVLGRYLTDRNLGMHLWDSEGPGEGTAIEAIRQGVVDGVIFTTATSQSVAVAEALRSTSPLVLINRTVREFDCDQVTSDNVAAGWKVADYLVQAGHQRIGLISGPPQASTAAERRAGLEAGLAHHGMRLNPQWLQEGEFSHAYGRETVRRWLGMGSDAPTAIFCANDLIALGAIDGARSFGAQIPRDLWIVGHDNIAAASWDSYDLTTVRQSVTEMVKTALRLLLSRIDNRESAPTFCRLPSDLVIRGSTAGNPYKPSAVAPSSLS